MRLNFRVAALAAALTAGSLLATPSAACTRVMYQGIDGEIITARSMDWFGDIGTNLWIFPRGASRSGTTDADAVRWTSKYGSIIASAYDLATTDGMNEKGLAVELLWLADSQYPEPQPNQPGMVVSVWAQYILDNFATVDEAVAELQKQEFVVVTTDVPGEQDMQAMVHMAMSDPTGDSAVVEYVDGKLVIHHGRQYQVMTNSPTYGEQLAIDAYWKGIGGTVFLPGTNRSADRFARASFYVNAVPKTNNPLESLASVFGVIRNVSVPYGLSTPDQPDISSTRWRTVADQKNRVYFFESAFTPNTFWVDLKQVDFSEETGKVLKLDLGPNQENTFSGEASGDFQPAEPFVFLGT